MEIIVHFPSSPMQYDELRRRVAAVHADMIVKRIQKLPCPADQKKELTNYIISDIAKLE